MERTRHSAFKISGYPTTSIEGTGKQLVVLDLLQHYDLLPSKLIRQHVGKDAYAEALLTRLTAGHYIRLPDHLIEQEPKPRNKTYLYQLADRGKALLQDKQLWLGREAGNDHHSHKLLRSQVHYAFDHPPEGLQLITEQDVLTDHRCPKSTAKLPHPSYFSIGKYEVQPDGPVFGYERNNVFIFFHGFEADNGTEDIRETDKNRYTKVSLELKLRMYTAYFERGLHMSLYGLKRVYVPFVFKPGLQARMKTVISILKEKYPEYQDRFIFTEYVPNLVEATWYTTTGTFNIIDKLKGAEHGRQVATHPRADKREGED